MRNFIALAATLSLSSVPALAQTLGEPRFYGTVGYTAFDGEEANLGAITARIGAKVHPNFGVEGEGSLGLKDEKFAVSINGAGKYELKNDLAAYAVAFLPVNEQFELFARAGYGATKIRTSVSGVNPLQTGGSLNYGLGANYVFDGANGLRADWTRRDFRDDRAGNADTWSLSYIRRF